MYKNMEKIIGRIIGYRFEGAVNGTCYVYKLRQRGWFWWTREKELLAVCDNYVEAMAAMQKHAHEQNEERILYVTDFDKYGNLKV